MHGRPRPPKGFEPSVEQRQRIEKRTQLIKSATTEVLTRIENREYDPQTLSMSAKLLALNPEIYTVWNYRKESLDRFFALESTTDDVRRQHLRTESALTEQALSTNPKSYSSWHHRVWIVDQNGSDAESEFTFVEQKLEEDSRNFHAWNYRQFLVKKFNRSPEREFEFSQQKIDQNFSNYSAWHHRIQCLESLHQPIATVSFNDLIAGKTTTPIPSTIFVPIKTLKSDLEMVHSAFVTDPDDSSAWLYYRWLITRLLAHKRSDTSDKDELQLVLDAEMAFFKQELLPLDPNSKWILISYAMLSANCLDTLRTNQQASSELNDIYAKLMEVDPMRKGFYQDVCDGKTSVLIGVVLALKAKCRKYTVIDSCCREYSKYTCPKCNCPYCSLDCYKQHNTTCTERFYKRNVDEALQSKRASEEDKRKVEEILQRLHTVSSESDSVDSDAEPLEQLTDEQSQYLQQVCEGEDEDVSDLLPPELLKEFHHQLQIGFRSDLVPTFVFWWEKKEVEDVRLSETGMALTQMINDEPAASLKSDLPMPPQTPLHKLSELRKGSTSQTVPWQIVQVLFAYCFVLRKYNGDWSWDTPQVIPLLIRLCTCFDPEHKPTDSRQQMMHDLHVHCVSPPVGDPSNKMIARRVLVDVCHMVTQGRSVCILALQDFQRMVQACLVWLNEQKTVTRVSETKATAKLLRAGDRKLTFLMCWTNEPVNSEQLSNTALGIQTSMQDDDDLSKDDKRFV